MNLSGVVRFFLSTLTSLNSPYGTSGAKNGIGASLLGLAFLNTTDAHIDSGALVNAQNVTVEADTTQKNIMLAEAGGKAARNAVEGVISVVVIDNNTTADIASGAVIDAGGAVTGTANDNLLNINVAGGAVTGQNIGFGGSVGTNVITRNTTAYIGTPQDATPDTTPASITAKGAVTVQATASGDILGFALAGAYTSTSPQAPVVPVYPNVSSDSENDVDGLGGVDNSNVLSDTDVSDTDDEALDQDPNTQQNAPPASNLGIAGDVMVNVVKDTTLAYINEQKASTPSIVAGSLSVMATNNTQIAGVAGSAAISTGGTSSSTGIAGSIAANAVISTTNAFIHGDNIQAGSLTMKAIREGSIVAIAAGGSGAPMATGTAGSGSLTLNLVLPNTDAYVSGSTLALGGTSHVMAQDTSLIWSVAGAASYGGKTGIGASTAVNLIGFSNQLQLVPNQPATTDAYITGSTVTMAGGTLSVTAENQNSSTNPRIIAITGTLGMGSQPQSSGVAAMVSVNIIKEETEAYISNSSVTENPLPAGATTDPNPVSVVIMSTDTSGIVAVGFAAGVGQGAAVGAALGYNETHDTLLAEVSGTTINDGGTVTVQSTSNQEIGGAVAGVGAGTGTGWAAAGSAEVNQIVDSIHSAIDSGSSVSAGGNIGVTARDTSLLVSVAGTGAGTSGSYAFGASIGYNRVSNAITADIDHATVHSTGGSVNVTATSAPLLIAIGGAGTGATGGGGIAGAGTVDVNSIANTVDADIESADVIAVGSVDVVASEAASLYAASLAGAGASSGSALGTSIAYNFLGGVIDPSDPNIISYENGTVPGTSVATVSGDNTTTTSNVAAYIDQSSVTAGGQVVVQSGFVNPNSLAQQGPTAGADVSINTASGVIVTGDALYFASPHGLETGDAVVYHDGGGPVIGGLTDGQVYYVIKVDNHTIKLALYYANAVAGVAIALSSVGNNAQMLTPFNQSQQFAIDPSKDISGNEIAFTDPDGMTLGEEIGYDDQGGTPIGGLASGRTYYVIPMNDDDIELASSYANAKNGIAIPLSYSGPSQQQTLIPTVAASALTVPTSGVSITNPLADTIAVSAKSGLQTGDTVVYHSGGGAEIGGLTDGETYYVIAVDSTHIRLATSLVNAENGVPIPLTSTGTGSDQTLEETVSQVSVANLAFSLPTAIDAQITSVTAAGAGGQTISGAGAVSLNFVRMNVDAHISNTPAHESVQGSGGVSVQANDSSQINSGAGSLGVATGQSAAINASVGVNDIKNNVTATIAGADVQSSGGAVTVDATEKAQDINIVVGGAVSGGGGNAFGGSFAFNFVQNTVGAAIKSNAAAQPSYVSADQSVVVLADDVASIATLAGNVGAAPGGTAAAAVAFAFNQIADNDTATINDAMVGSTAGSIDVNAEFAPPVDRPS